jgi:membrane protease YdiL (CAAX protease family)
MKDTEEYAGEITERFLAVSTIQGFLVNLFMIALIPAVGEEFLFRGVLQKIFIEWTKNIHWGIIISALLFSTFHLQFYGFLPRLMLGIFFGYLFVWSGSLWLPVLAHFFNNSVAVFFYFIAGKEMNDKIDTLGAGTFKASDIILLIVSVVLVSAIIILVFRKEKRVL